MAFGRGELTLTIESTAWLRPRPLVEPLAEEKKMKMYRVIFDGWRQLDYQGDFRPWGSPGVKSWRTRAGAEKAMKRSVMRDFDLGDRIQIEEFSTNN